MAEDVYRKEDNENTPETVKAKDTPEENKSNTTTSSSEKITVKVGKNYDSFNNTIAEIENTAKYPERGHESFMINKKTHSAIAIRQNGQINLSSSLYSQYKLNPSGKSVEQTLESVAITNRRKVLADDMVLNEHKLNPYLYEITDMKKLETAHNDHMLVGNMCLFGSVLVKAWEQKWRRGDPHMDLPGPGFLQEPHDAPAGGPADYGIVDQDHAFISYRFLYRGKLDIHLVQPVIRGDESPADVFVLYQSYTVGYAGLHAVSYGGIQTGIRYAHHDIRLYGMYLCQGPSGILPCVMDRHAVYYGIRS